MEDARSHLFVRLSTEELVEEKRLMQRRLARLPWSSDDLRLYIQAIEEVLQCRPDVEAAEIALDFRE